MYYCFLQIIHSIETGHFSETAGDTGGGMLPLPPQGRQRQKRKGFKAEGCHQGQNIIVLAILEPLAFF